MRRTKVSMTKFIGSIFAILSLLMFVRSLWMCALALDVWCAMCTCSCVQLSASQSIISIHVQRWRGKQTINIIKLYLTRHEHFDNRIYISFQFDTCTRSVHRMQNRRQNEKKFHTNFLLICAYALADGYVWLLWFAFSIITFFVACVGRFFFLYARSSHLVK